MDLSDRLRELRNEKGFTQNDVAEKLGVGRATIAGYETKGKQPGYEKLIRLTDLFNVSTDYLLGRADKPNNEDNDKPIDEPKTIAAHFDGEEYTEEELKEIENFKQWVADKRKNQ